MKFMGDAVDKVGLHLGKVFLPEPVAESDKENQLVVLSTRDMDE